MKTESALTDHFAGLQEIADTITRLREDNARLLAALKGMVEQFTFVDRDRFGQAFLVCGADGACSADAFNEAELAIAQAERAL